MFQPNKLPQAAQAVLDQVRALPLDDPRLLTPDERASCLAALEQIAGGSKARLEFLERRLASECTWHALPVTA